MITCSRCGTDVDNVQDISPDDITEEVLDSIDHGKDDFAGESVLRVCGECMDELQQN